MTLFNSIVLYLIIWWLALFIFLPFWVTKQKKTKKGHDPGAPENPRLKLKIILTSIFSFIIWLIIFVIIKLN